MRILAIDYGRKKIGLALADSEVNLAEPHRVIRFETIEEALKKIEKETEEEKIEKIVVGVSEGKMAEETRNFGKKLRDKLGIPVAFQDETLTTQEAQRFSIEAGIKRKKRKNLEDAYSAAIILQDYLNLRGNT